MEAGAEPLPPTEEFDSDSKKIMLFRAALILYHVDSSDDVQMAIEELVMANYSLEDVDSPCRMTLLWAMEAGPTSFLQLMISLLQWMEIHSLTSSTNRL
jgi:hypothetical protein